MGRKWSLYLKTQMQLVFEHFNIKNAESEMTDNIVILKIKREKRIIICSLIVFNLLFSL